MLVIDWFDRNGHSFWLKKGERRKTGSWGKGGMQKRWHTPTSRIVQPSLTGLMEQSGRKASGFSLLLTL